MAEVSVYDLKGEVVDKLTLPHIFETPIRPDVVKRAVIALQSHRFQPQGRSPMSGKHTTARSIGTGFNMARLPRVKGSRYPKARQAAFAPNAVGGRPTHPPTSEKVIYKRINRQERRLAIRSAIAATAIEELVSGRGHLTTDSVTFPIVVSDDLQNLSKTSEVQSFFEKLGIWDDVERVKYSRRVRAGKGKMRGRRYKQAVGPLLVIGEDNGVIGAAGNHPGVDIIEVERLNAELLAPGTHLGRLTIWTKSAIQRLDGLFRRT